MSLFVLGLKALWRERMLLLFTSAGLAAVLGPLLVLYGFKFGAIAALLTALREDPANREIIFRGNYVLAPTDIERFRSMPEVAFVLPATRTIAARMEFVGPPPDPAATDSGIYPTAIGDPLLPAGSSLTPTQVALSSALADRLRAKPGDVVKARNQRTMASGPEEIVFDLTVAYVIDRRFAVGNRAYLTVDSLFALEAFLDGYALPKHGIAEGKPLSERVPAAANVRLYARSIEDVPALARRLGTLGIGISSKADEVEGILGLNRSLDAIFGLIAGIGSAGYAVSLSASLLGSMRQQRKFLSLVRLMGAGRFELMSFPLAQGSAISLVGFAMSIALFSIVASVANARLSSQFPAGTSACNLAPEHFLVAIGATVFIVGSVALFIGRSLLSVSPAEVLHAE
jgi:putative ABC transport system permease protein